ncbi:hypothetical protein ACFL0L_04805 [Patescibacteria group bacterium]
MNPKTDIRYRRDYAKKLYQGDREFEDVWMDIIKFGGIFEEVFELYQEKILKAIPSLSGYEWGEHTDPFIPIYIVFEGESFSQPLTIQAQEDTSAMLVDVITQLVQCNLHYGFKTPAERVAAVQVITTAVTDVLDVDLSDAIQDMNERNIYTDRESYKLPEWDLSSQTAKAFLEN